MKYPGFIFLCPKKLSKQNPRKKNKVLELSKYYPRIFFWIWLCSRFFLCPKNYPGKKTNTLNYPNSIRFFLDSSKNIEFFCHFYIFQKNWQCLSLCFCQAYRLTIAGCIKKMTLLKNLQVSMNTLNYPISIPEKNQTPWTIRYFRDLAKFSWILHENKNFYNLCFFCKNLAMFNSVL